MADLWICCGSKHISVVRSNDRCTAEKISFAECYYNRRSRTYGIVSGGAHTENRNIDFEGKSCGIRLLAHFLIILLGAIRT